MVTLSLTCGGAVLCSRVRLVWGWACWAACCGWAALCRPAVDTVRGTLACREPSWFSPTGPCCRNIYQHKHSITLPQHR